MNITVLIQDCGANSSKFSNIRCNKKLPAGSFLDKWKRPVRIDWPVVLRPMLSANFFHTGIDEPSAPANPEMAHPAIAVHLVVFDRNGKNPPVRRFRTGTIAILATDPGSGRPDLLRHIAAVKFHILEAARLPGPESFRVVKGLARDRLRKDECCRQHQPNPDRNTTEQFVHCALLWQWPALKIEKDLYIYCIIPLLLPDKKSAIGGFLENKKGEAGSPLRSAVYLTTSCFLPSAVSRNQIFRLSASVLDFLPSRARGERFMTSALVMFLSWQIAEPTALQRSWKPASNSSSHPKRLISTLASEMNLQSSPNVSMLPTSWLLIGKLTFGTNHPGEPCH